MQHDRDKLDDWFQISTGFMQGDMNAPFFFNIFLVSMCSYIESKLGDLGFRLAYNIDRHLTGRRRPKGSQPCHILPYADDMVNFEKRAAAGSACCSAAGTRRVGHAYEHPQDTIHADLNALMSHRTYQTMKYNKYQSSNIWAAFKPQIFPPG